MENNWDGYVLTTVVKKLIEIGKTAKTKDESISFFEILNNLSFTSQDVYDSTVEMSNDYTCFESDFDNHMDDKLKATEYPFCVVFEETRDKKNQRHYGFKFSAIKDIETITDFLKFIAHEPTLYGRDNLSWDYNCLSKEQQEEIFNKLSKVFGSSTVKKSNQIWGGN